MSVAYQSMERMLEELGARWAAVCQWIDDKWMHLQDVDVKWRSYHSNADLFNKWLDEQEVLLGRMKLSNISDPTILLNQVQRLKDIESEMDGQMGRYDELNSVGLALISYLPSFPQTTEKIQLRLEEYKQRWDKVVQMMEQQSKLIAESGINPEAVIAATGKHKQAVIEEYNELELKVSQWIDKSENTFQLLGSDDRQGGLTLEEQSVLLKDTCEEALDIHVSIERVQSLSKHDSKQLGEKRLKLTSVLCEKWESVNCRLQEFEDLVEVKVQHKQACNEVIALRDASSNYNNWVKAVPAVIDLDTTEIGKLCEQCRVKVKAMRQQHERVDRLYALRHSKCVVNDEELKSNINTLYTDWFKVLALIEGKMDSLSHQLTQSPPKKYLDAKDALIKWLSDVEEVLAERVYITDISTMEKKITLYQDLQKAIAEHVADVEYVNRTGKDLVKSSSLTSTDTSNTLQVQLSSLNSRWQAVSENIDDKLTYLAQGIDKLKQFESQVNGLTRWMSDMEHFLEVEQPVVGDTETLQAQISQSDGALSDINTLQSVVDEINTTCTSLVSGSEEDFGVELSRELEKMNERWTDINKISQAQNRLLKDALAKSTSLVENITSLNSFLTEFDAEISEKLMFTTKADLDASCEKVKRLEASLEKRKSQLQLIQTVSSDLMGRSRQDSLPRLLNRLKHIDHKWKLVADRLLAKQEECSDVSTKYSDFLSIVQSEETYICQLKDKLIIGDNQAVDAEDMAAEMDELESLLEERDRQSSATLTDLASWFKQTDILTGETMSVESELDIRRAETIEKVRERVALLDRASQKSQDTELKLTEMETWMNEVNILFREWNDQDLLAGDLPEDSKTLSEEFSEKDAFLHSIESQIKDFGMLGKTLAAERLEKKLDLIKEDYSISQQNFLKWQRPVDFDPKLRRAQQQLHEIDDKIYLIEIFNEDPEHVSIRLEQCTKFYGIMSDIKTEVEYVIKTGRQLVEKKQVDFPRRVSQTLDALKSLYNRLGSQISQARKDLDKASKMSKVIAKHVAKVSSLVESAEARLAQPIVCLDEETLWLEEIEKEFERVHATLTAISTLYDQFQLYADETALDEAKENLESLKERWQVIIQALAARLRSIQAQKSNADADFEMFNVKSRNLLAELQSLKSLPDNAENLQKLQAELVTLKGEVTTLNNNAVDISTKGGSYKEQIIPIIDSVNHTYQELSHSAQLNGEELVMPSISESLSESPQSPNLMETESSPAGSNESYPAGSNESVIVFLQLRESLRSTTYNPYEVASMFAKCEVAQKELSDHDKEEFHKLLAEWKSKRNSTVARWQSYELNSTLMSIKLLELEQKLDMAQTQSDLLKEIEEEIARRQVEVNALNEQAEDLTEHDTPPIDQHLLQLNQRWVGIRSRVANFKPTNGMTHPANGTVGLQLSPPTKQKYEYAVINKNRTNQTPVTITSEIQFAVESPMSAHKKEMALVLESPVTPTNNNVLFVTSPSSDSFTSPSKSLTPGSGIDVDDESISLDEMTASTSSKRSIVVTDLDKAAETVSTDSLSPDISVNLQSTAMYSEEVSADCEEALEEVRRLLSRVGILEQQLRNSGIEIDQYTHENFSSSQHLLKSVRISMEVLEDDIKQTESRFKSQAIYASAQLKEALNNLSDTWNTLSASYRQLQSNFDEALTLWTQFHHLLRVITTWLDSTEKILKRSRDKSGELIVSQAKDIQKELEEGMTEHQAIVHSLARTAVPLAGKLRPSDAERITDKVSTVTSRWREMTLEIRGRKPRLDTMADSGKCLDVMDDLSFWLDETEIIITSSPDYTDELSLKDALEKIKDRSEELPHKNEAIDFVCRSSKDLWNLPGLKADDRQKLGRDMQRINRKWAMITTAIQERQRYLESCIENLEDLLFEIGKLNQELWQAIEDLQPNMSLENFATIKKTYPRNQAVSIETLNAWYREVLLLYKRNSVILPRNMEAHYRRLNIRWSAIKERTQLNRAGSDSSIEETLATGSSGTPEAVDADNIFDEPRQSIFIDDHIPITRVQTHPYATQAASSTANGTEDEECPPPPPRRESLAPSSLQQLSPGRDPGSQPSLMLNREETLALLRDRLATLNRTVSNKRVDVTDHTQITDSQVKVTKLTVAVQEILRQLSMFPEADNQVSGLRTECAECQVRSLARGKELKHLLIDSHKYGNQMAQVDSWLCQLEAKINARKNEALGDAVGVVDKQIQQHMALESEVQSWQENYALLNQMTEHLLTTYPNEDTSTLSLNGESLAVRWNSVQLFLSEQGRTLNTHKQTLEDFDKTLTDFLLWVTEQESLADILFEEVKDNHPMRSSTWLLRSKDLQSQIDSHQKAHELLSVTGKKVVAAGDDSDTQVIKKRLDEMNERWTQLRAKTVQIRCRLESSMDQWSELISKCRLLIDYLMTRENELIAARPVSGNLPGIKQQQGQHEDWKMRLDGKTSDFEHTITTGRFYLEKEGADRRLSSASCDSRIMDELSVECTDAKTVIKNIRRHIRLLNQKWVELHNKSERWQNQLAASEKCLEDINNLLNIATRHLNQADNNIQSWKNVNDYPVADLPRQLTTTRALRRKNEEVSEVLNKSKAIVKAQEEAEGAVDMDTRQSISLLADRQQTIEKQMGDRVSQLVSLNRSLVPEVSDLLRDSVSRPYERAATSAEVPYYINHDKKTTQWDHPRMVNLLAQLPKFNATKFSAYRTAQKLRKMQKALGLNSIRLKDVIRACQEHDIVSTAGEEIIDVNVIISCLRDLFEHLADERHASGVNVPLSIDLSLNWLLNVFDLGRQGQIRCLSFQVGLVIMCRGAVEDKFNYLLSCLADKSGMIEEKKLSLLLSDCIQIPRQLGELSSFGGANIEPSVQSCLEQAKGRASVNCRQFMDWLALEPQSMVWLPVYHRLATSESCRHQAKCSLCKSTPIIGLRYRCLRCFNFNLCQTCFFTGKKGKSHKLNHPMKEYYCASTSNDEMKDLSSPMRKKYSSGRYIKKHNPKGYLPLTKLGDVDSTFSRESHIKVECDCTSATCKA